MRAFFALAAAMIIGCGTAYADELPKWDVDDKPAPIFSQRDAKPMEKEPANVPESQGEPISDGISVSDEYTPTVEYFEPYTASESAEGYYPTDCLTQDGGINYHDGRLETWYSSQVLPHYRQGEWTTDEEGYWRTDDGYYVVAASDMEQGTVFEGSKGECIVLDSGCAEGTTDYYTNWG